MSPDPGPRPGEPPTAAEPFTRGHRDTSPRDTRHRDTRHRDTRQGELVRDTLAATDGFRSAQALYAILQASGAAVGLSTVYRHLQALVDTGEVDAIHDPGGHSVYRFCGPVRTGRSHHHLICRVCGRAEELDGRIPDRWADDVARTHGYREVARTVEIFGVCPTCQSRGGSGIARHFHQS